MNDEGTLGLQNWGRYYRPLPLKGDPGLQLMPLTMPFLSDGHDSANPRRECGIPDTFFPKRCFFPQKGIPELHSMPVDYARDLWYHNNNENGKILPFYGSLLPEATVDSAGFNTHMLRMLQPVDLPKDVKTEVADNSDIPPQVIVPLKKRSKGHGEGRPIKGSKTKKVIVTMEKPCNSSGRRRAANKNLDVVINGVDLDLSEIPAPLCTCTGRPQQCYRWGAGGWQSACCTTSVSMYPLPMNTKRRGARIAGRKMSLGAFKKVLEKLAMEGQDISSPIDLKPFWAKHGTNKFVTIR